MLTTCRKIGPFNIKEVWFAEEPADLRDCDGVVFRACKKIAPNSNGFKRSDFPTLVVDLTKDLDDLWEKMEKKSCRYEISRALREGVRVQPSTDYDTFNKIYRVLEQSKNLNAPLDLDYLSEYSTLFLAFIGDDPVAGHVYLKDADNIRWLLGASKRVSTGNVLISSANRLLTWEAIKSAKAAGVKEFDFGGYCLGERKEELAGVNFFKKSFGGELTTHYIYRKDYSVPYRIAKWALQKE